MFYYIILLNTDIKMAKLKSKKGAWFIKIRGSYLPCSTAGWLTYIPFTAYLIFSMIFGYTETDSILMVILVIAPNWLASSAVMTYIAERKS